ncbi:MAG: hypothetical protein HRU07_06620 [Nitrosopumilus sp.]|nr:hypothetical protein [Nitrosopumilus sp.]NRA05814.1 hypothetical protein [Nitrosopumilus sp.]
MSVPFHIDNERNRNKKLKKEIELLKRQTNIKPLRTLNNNRGRFSSFGNGGGTTNNNGGGQAGSDDSGKIKDYGTVSGVVTIDQAFKSHVMTLGDNIVIEFDDNVDSEHLKELLFEIIQPVGQTYEVS